MDLQTKIFENQKSLKLQVHVCSVEKCNPNLQENMNSYSRVLILFLWCFLKVANANEDVYNDTEIVVTVRMFIKI